MTDDDRQPSGRRIAAWFLLATVLLIFYASFYPFDFDWQRLAHADGGHMPQGLRWRHSTPGDALANLLFYLPLGALLAYSLPRAWPVAGRWLLTALAGACLSFAFEYLQYAARTRVANLSDVAYNTLSAALGAWIGLRPAQLIALLRGPEWRHARPDVVPLVLVAFWTALHAAPFLPRLGFARIWTSLTPVRELSWSVGGIAFYFAAWLTVSGAVRALLARRHFWQTFACAVAGTFAARLLFTGHRLPFDECLGLALALPCIVRLRRYTYPTAAGPTAWLCATGWLIHVLAPPPLQASMPAYDWLPFLYVLEQALLQLGILWLATIFGLHLAYVAAGMLCAAIVASIGAQQLWDRAFDPWNLLVIAIAVVVVAAAQRLGIRPRQRAPG